MKYVKSLLMILSCIMVLLVGCTGENPNSIQADVENESTESVTSPETNYDPALLSYISIQDGFHIADYGKSMGTNYSYAVFNMRTDEEAEEEALYWEIVVMQKNSVIMVLRVDNEEHGAAFPAPSEMVVEADVNFDGNHDILICLGHFGNQGLVLYKCFLSTDTGFVLCPSFAEIANPSVDYAEQVVRSQWRNGAASHGWGIFKFINNEFIETERLTEEAVDYEAGEPIWSWKEEVFLEGEWQTRDYYTQKDSDSKTIQNRLYGPDSYWGLDQPKWNTLFNEGKMSDFSIYKEDL